MKFIKSFVVLVCAGLPGAAYSKNKPDGSIKSKFNYTIYSSKYPVDKLDGPVNSSTQESVVLKPGTRDKVFQKSGISSYVAGWDHFAKDILIVKATKMPLNELAKNYSRIPRPVLAKLQQQLKARK